MRNKRDNPKEQTQKVQEAQPIAAAMEKEDPPSLGSRGALAESSLDARNLS